MDGGKHTKGEVWRNKGKKKDAFYDKVILSSLWNMGEDPLKKSWGKWNHIIKKKISRK